MTVTSTINRLLRRFVGIEVHKTKASFDEARLYAILSTNVSLIVDGGANEGQWAKRIRRDGYTGRLLSIEPGSSAFNKLLKYSSDDEAWETLNVALGSKEETAELYLSNNDGMSSSLKKPGRHLVDFPTVKFAGSERVSVNTLENLLSQVHGNVMLKLDIQGFEMEALEGVGSALDKISVIEVEMTLHPMYQGENSVGQILYTIENMGFELFSISEFGKGKNGQVSYFDVIALRKNNTV